MKIHCIAFFGFLMILHLSTDAKETIELKYSVRTDSLPKNILIMSSFDAMSMKARKNKKELFEALTDRLKQVLCNEISAQKEERPIVISELIKDTTDSDSTILSLMLQNNAAKAIVIKNIDAFFDQTNVEVTKKTDGKERIASFYICAVINYRFYNSEERFQDSEIEVCEFFTRRNVVSGYLAVGPDIVGKRIHAFKIVQKNALAYLVKEASWKNP
jgi:hypothetical protein